VLERYVSNLASSPIEKEMAIMIAETFEQDWKTFIMIEQLATIAAAYRQNHII